MIDYSKWKKIEISDDEDDTHPNIDTASLFRWRHDARLQRMAEQRNNRQELRAKEDELIARFKQLPTNGSSGSGAGGSGTNATLDETVDDSAAQSNTADGSLKCEKLKLVQELENIRKQMKELDQREQRQAWNVDTISHDSWSKTVLNRNCLRQQQQQQQEQQEQEEEQSPKKTSKQKGKKVKKGTDSGDVERQNGGDVEHDVGPSDDVVAASSHDEEDTESSDEPEIDTDAYAEFIKEHEPEIKEFAFHSRFDDCRRYLLEHPNIVHRHTLDYMSLWCIQLNLDGKQSLLEHVAQQTVMIQMIIDLAKTGGNVDPRSCLAPFFTKAKIAMNKFQQLLSDELRDFKERIGKASDMRIDRAIKEQELEPEKLIGPGGLDAQEVFESLPIELQKCFEARDQEMLRETLAAMDQEQAAYHLRRCVDAGLWLMDKPEDEDELLFQKVVEKNKDRFGDDTDDDSDFEADDEEQESDEVK